MKTLRHIKSYKGQDILIWSDNTFTYGNKIFENISKAKSFIDKDLNDKPKTYYSETLNKMVTIPE